MANGRAQSCRLPVEHFRVAIGRSRSGSYVLCSESYCFLTASMQQEGVEGVHVPDRAFEALKAGDRSRDPAGKRPTVWYTLYRRT